ncbi:hypothetical protein L596_012354 [Steinernema carpocapsae]|uniref:Agouti domain-containing protein n=1 Tax=Steinernema carpocapsae TaxID=34508 RepID=A0A4U5NX21_STECR|nr:hypothetical protein L596_012354 [Steinernema carpocapsae]
MFEFNSSEEDATPLQKVLNCSRPESLLHSFFSLTLQKTTRATRLLETMNIFVGCTLLFAFTIFAYVQFNHASPIGVTSVERSVNSTALQLSNGTSLATVDTLSSGHDLSNSTELVRSKRQGGGCGCGCCCCRPRCCCCRPRCCCCCVRCCCRVVCCRPCCRPCCGGCGCGCGCGGGGFGRKRRSLTDLTHKLMDKQAQIVAEFVAFEETTTAAPEVISIAQMDSFGRRSYAYVGQEKKDQK